MNGAMMYKLIYQPKDKKIIHKWDIKEEMIKII